jgi:hypothetical protein
MHACSTVAVDQLLNLRDEQPVDAVVRTHVERCANCSQELARLKTLRSALRALPALTAPPYNSAGLRARLRSVRTYRAATFAAAASICALTLLLITAVTGTRSRVESVATNTDTTLTTPSTEDAATDTSVNSLVIRSQELEARLQRLPRRPHIERASTSTTIDSLQSRIQWVDYQLSVASDVGITEGQSARLWENRIELMDSLLKVRYAEAQRTSALLIGSPRSSL